ncbi:MAG: methyl-accepting chemotaxis protein [Desulfurivibrio sp.]|nr:methyl-accepting chemotaxis protein [Desulfurivibrio sp.]
MGNQKTSRLSLKQKALLPLLLSVLVAALLAGPLVLRELNQLRDDFVQQVVSSKQSELKRAVDKAGEEALEKAAPFTSLPAVQRAYELAHRGNIQVAKDPLVQEARELLREELSGPIKGFKELTGKPLQLHYHLPSGRSLARVWRERQTQRNGEWVDISDDLSGFRPTVLEVNRNKQTLHGIEVGRSGLMIRGMAPITDSDGRHLGSVEMQAEFDKIFQAAVEPGQNMQLYLNAEQLDTATKLQDSSKHPMVDNRYVLASGTRDGNIGQRINADLLDGGRQGLTIRQDGDLALAAFPVHDFRDQQIAVITLALDTSGISAGVHTIFMILGAISALVLLLIVVVNYTSLQLSVIKPINNIAGEMLDGAAQVSASSSQVSAGSQELAEGASQQAASLEETSASLEEISTMTRQNADNASSADGLMKEAGEVIKRAESSMGELTASMQEISKASEETNKIIKTIDEIAFQTNLLALNAAVEAARAGEAGAGFAVVADEVRNLALRAAEAAKNTAELIDGTVTKINTGVQVVERTNSEFNEVATSTGKAATLVGEIAVASNEQSKGIGQLNTAMGEMDQVVQRTAANAEESAASSEELNAMAAQMESNVMDLLELVGIAANQIGKTGQKQQKGRQKPAGGQQTKTSQAAAQTKRIAESTGDQGKDRKPQNQGRTSAGSGSKGQTGQTRQATAQTSKSKNTNASGATQTNKEGGGQRRSNEVIPFDDDDFQDF